MELEEILNKTVKSILALTSRNILLQLISAVALTLLGAFLLPGEIGVFIIVTSLLRIFTFFTDLGLGAALVQKKGELEPQDMKTAFTIQTILVGAVTVIGLVLTPKIASYAHLSPPAIFLYQVLVCTLFISSLKMIPSILLERKLAFERQVIPQIFESLIFHTLVVFLAARHFGIASYSWAVLASALAGLPLYFLVSPWRPSVGFSLKHAKHLIRFGIPFQGKSVLAIIKDDLLTLFLSGIVGPGGIGYWGFSQRFAYYPFRFIVDSVTKVSFPAYSRIQNNAPVLKIGIEKSLFAVSLFIFPMLLIMALLAQNIIVLIPKYHQWLPALPTFYFLCAGAAVSALSNILINSLDATGRVKTTLGLMVMWITLTWLLTLALVNRFGFTGIAMASFLVSLTIIVTIYFVKKIVDFNFVKSVYKPFLSSILMGIFVFALVQTLPNTFATLILKGLAGAIIYLGMMYVLARKELIADLKIVIKSFRK